jgi:hypothetical protein
MPGRSRKACAEIFEDLADVLLPGVIWNLSAAFLSSQSIDDPGFSPLDNVEWNLTAGRHESKDPTNDDDCILQAMVMWNLYRLEKSWGRPKMLVSCCFPFVADETKRVLFKFASLPFFQWIISHCFFCFSFFEKQLSVWAHPKQPCESDLKNLWKDEIETTKKLCKGLNHADNFDAFCRYYQGTNNFPSRWQRRSDTSLNYVHVFAEQATVQWALEVKDPHLQELAAGVIRYQNEASDPKELGTLLLVVAERCGDDGSFCKQVLLTIEEEDAPSGKRHKL